MQRIERKIWAQTNSELREIWNELKTVQQQLEKATAHWARAACLLAHVLLALFVVIAGLMLGRGKAN
ncbi:uncharacterized protein C2845_PM03G32670 [Panicum miliaceum]|uniref:Uncharacterized protein n=1 Tax=Panicum miliaceum TaxID=4540 RepID=A0A3L6TB24_PANMI|nr:uncharacterized protein C2845_PM03G32670 [Panicum miliaceum]